MLDRAKLFCHILYIPRFEEAHVSSNICVLPAFVFGILNMIVAFLISQLKGASLFQITIQMTGMLNGPLAGIFFLGILVPFVNTMVTEMNRVILSLV